MKKAQVNMAETVIVIFIFVVLLGLFLIYYTQFRSEGIEQEAKESKTASSTALLSVLSSVPEIKCSEKAKEEQTKLGQIYEQELKKEIKTQVKPEIKTEVKTEIKAETEKPKEEKIKIKEEKIKEGKIKESYDPIGNFFIDNQVDVLDWKIIKKNKEMNYVAGINTDLGKGVFFLKYKNKGKIKVIS